MDSESNSIIDGPLALVIDGGVDKDGRDEPVRRVEVETGQVVALVGPTGSGKTRLLADIERLAQGDSPSARCVTLVGAPSANEEGLTPVARISQSMGFVLDATAAGFLRLRSGTLTRASLPGMGVADITTVSPGTICT